MVSDELLKDIATLHESWAKDRQIWIAASTHEGEEELILQAHHLLLKKHPNLLLLLVPRHPERFNPVADLIEKANFTLFVVSTGEIPSRKYPSVFG